MAPSLLNHRTRRHPLSALSLGTRPLRRLLTAGALTGVVLAGLALTPAQADPISPGPTRPTSVYRPAEFRMKAKLEARATTATFGSSFTGAVVDAASGRVVWSRNGTTGLMPASTTKLVTATDALRVFGASHRFVTSVKRGPSPDQVILVGSGDPAFSTAQVATLARATAAATKAAGRTTVRLYADDHLFPAPTLATGWKSTYIPADTTWLRALVVDGRQSSDTSIDAAQLFAAQLKANGVTATKIGRGRAAVDAPVIATSAGLTVGQIVTPMLLNSDNEHAEALHRLVAIEAGYGSTWTAASTAQQALLGKEGLSATALHDGSGLSRSGRLSGLQLARIVANAFEPGNATRARPAALRHGAADLWPDRDPQVVARPVHDRAVHVRGRPRARQDRHVERRRRAVRLDGRGRRPGEDLRVRGQRQERDARAEAGSGHAGRHGHRLLLTS